MKELNRFRQFLSENQNYVINSGEDFMLNNEEAEKFFKSKGYDDEMIDDMFDDSNFQEDLEGIVNAFVEGGELDQNEIENLLIQAANFYEGNYENLGEVGKKITEIFNFSSNKGYTEKTIFSDETKKVEFMDAVRRKLRQLTGDKFDYVDDEGIFDIFKSVVGYDQAYGNRKRDYMNDLDNVVVDIIRDLRNDLSLYI